MHSIERIQKVIDDYFVDMLDKKGDWVIRPDNDDLVRFAVEILKEFEELFDGTLGDWRTEPVSFELKEGAKPHHGMSYPDPKIRKETTIKELNRLCKLGVMEFQPASEWASPSFIIPKSDQTVRMISDFREVNKRLVRKPFPIPKISIVL